MGWTYSEFRREPAFVVKRWMAMLATESKALAKRNEIERKQAAARSGTRH
jgi:hypothetical protein